MLLSSFHRPSAGRPNDSDIRTRREFEGAVGQILRLSSPQATPGTPIASAFMRRGNINSCLAQSLQHVAAASGREMSPICILPPARPLVYGSDILPCFFGPSTSQLVHGSRKVEVIRAMRNSDLMIKRRVADIVKQQLPRSFISITILTSSTVSRSSSSRHGPAGSGRG